MRQVAQGIEPLPVGLSEVLHVGPAFRSANHGRQGDEEPHARQEAIEGCKRFTKLAEAYADEIIAQTRKEHKRTFPTGPPTENHT